MKKIEDYAERINTLTEALDKARLGLAKEQVKFLSNLLNTRLSVDGQEFSFWTMVRDISGNLIEAFDELEQNEIVSHDVEALSGVYKSAKQLHNALCSLDWYDCSEAIQLLVDLEDF